jgi:hypothetical protein
MVDCACTNFPGNLGNVFIGANLGVGMVPPVAPAGNIDVRSGR